MQVDGEQSVPPARSLGHAVEEAVCVVANSPAPQVDSASADVGYFEEQAPAAWCGMRALNNFLRGPYVTREACLAAANVVLQDLEARGGGFREALANHLDVNSGWLSVDVINVLGAANFNLHVEGERPCSFAAFKSSGHRAAFINWSNQHWTILERHNSGDGWVHINSIIGDGCIHGRKECNDAQIDFILEAIRTSYGSVSLFRITIAQPGRSGDFLEIEGRRALSIEHAAGPSHSNCQVVTSKQGQKAVLGDSRDGSVMGGRYCRQLRLVSLNVDGCGHYRIAPADRMDAILTIILDQKPDILTFQEVTSDMQVALQRRLRAGQWHFYRRTQHSEEYFNLTVVRDASWVMTVKSTSHSFPQTSNGRHLMKNRCADLTVYNGHLESGSQRRARAERKSQLEYVISMLEQEDGRPCVLAIDGNLREGEDACLLQAGWRDVWALAKKKPRQLWTWKHKDEQHTARYDRVYIHNGKNVSAECLEYDVIQEI